MFDIFFNLCSETLWEHWPQEIWGAIQCQPMWRLWAAEQLCKGFQQHFSWNGKEKQVLLLWLWIHCVGDCFVFLPPKCSVVEYVKSGERWIFGHLRKSKNLEWAQEQTLGHRIKMVVNDVGSKECVVHFCLQAQHSYVFKIIFHCLQLNKVARTSYRGNLFV